MINVNKTYLPPIQEYVEKLEGIWERGQVTNNGPLVLELEQKIKEYIGVKHVMFCGNGTIVLQIALNALDITGDVITTPYSYVATLNAILWQNANPVFVDINNSDFNIDALKIEQAITTETTAILATHVYGNPCNIELINNIAKKHNLKVIYDGAHAFGVKYKNRSIFSYGDISTCSLHATKIFHSIEGGLLITENDELARRIRLKRQFGHINDDYYEVGINGKNSEFHAAMGLCNIGRVSENVQYRKSIWNLYSKLLKSDSMKILEFNGTVDWNYSYFIVLFRSSEIMLKVKDNLQKENIFPRRYFYPSLNTLSFLKKRTPCEVSEDIASRVLALPFYYGIKEDTVSEISKIVNSSIE